MSDVGEAMDIDQPESTQLATTKEGVPAKSSIEGYVLIVQNVHEEASEDDVLEFFQDFGDVKNIHLNLDRQTGYVKGYALIEYKRLEDAKRAIKEGSNEELLGRGLSIDFAFAEHEQMVNPSDKKKERTRDRSPERIIES